MIVDIWLFKSLTSRGDRPLLFRTYPYWASLHRTKNGFARFHTASISYTFSSLEELHENEKSYYSNKPSTNTHSSYISQVSTPVSTPSQGLSSPCERGSKLSTECGRRTGETCLRAIWSRLDATRPWWKAGSGYRKRSSDTAIATGSVEEDKK